MNKPARSKNTISLPKASESSYNHQMLSYFDNTHLYSMLEVQRMAVSPVNMVARAGRIINGSPFNPWSYTDLGRSTGAFFELLERVTRNYDKPIFGISETKVDGKTVQVYEHTVISKPFGNLLHFVKDSKKKQEKLLIVAPMSGHYATLLRGTVEGMLPHFDVYITDWINARDVPLSEGIFDFDDYVEYVVEFLDIIEERAHVMAVCQPSVPVMAAVSLMATMKDPMVPKSMILIGGPIDTRKSPTKVNQLAIEKPLEWFEKNVITRVPLNYPGFMRKVYPGFIQLTGFMQLNLEKHVGEHLKLFEHLVDGDGDSADAHRKFYDEYLSVMDLDAEFYLHAIEHVFKEFSLPEGKMMVHGKLVKPQDITKTAVMCIEGEKDDISGQGQTKAALDLCKGLPADKKVYRLQKDVGHYGLFNGRRFREFIVPAIAEFIKDNV